MTWQPVIGLEIHVQLNTASKIFSGAATAYGALPNTQACAIDLGFPGVLPVLNQETVNKAIKFGLAVGAKINPQSVFSRKNYFYPDLPKGYQISQYDQPIVGLGHMDILLENNQTKRIGITRAHLEEDAGKSLHDDFQGMTGIDLNRAGTPLLEIVSEPDLRSPAEALAYMKAIHALVVYLDICDGNLQEGSFRCDANVSIHKPGEPLGTRAEIKNVNSFRFVEKAIQYEIDRQIDILASGGTIIQETRLYNADKNETRSMRSKEEAHDYRYFPCPDLLPVIIEPSQIEAIKQTLPELPTAKRERFEKDYGLSRYDAQNLVNNQSTADYFEAITNKKINPKLATNWVMGELAAALNKHNLAIKNSPVSADTLTQLLQRIEDKTISGKIAKQVFEALWEQAGTVDEIIDAKGLKQVTDTGEIEKIIQDILDNNPDQLADYKAGKDRLFGFFVGQVMKATKGTASPEVVNQLLRKLLGTSSH